MLYWFTQEDGTKFNTILARSASSNGTYCDLLGLLDPLLHVITLLFSCVSREDGELVELDAVHKSNPGLHANSLVGFAIDANPGILCVHLIDDPVPLHSHLADDEAMEQFVRLLGLFDRKGFLGLEGLVQIAELLFSDFLLGQSLIFREVEERAPFLTFTNIAKASFTSAAVPFCSTSWRTAMMWTKYSSLFPKP
jgi:hypothetical protein